MQRYGQSGKLASFPAEIFSRVSQPWINRRVQVRREIEVIAPRTEPFLVDVYNCR